MTQENILHVLALVLFYLIGMWSGYDKAKKKYRGF